MPKLIIQEGYQITGSFQIPQGESVIGRNDGIALKIDNHAGISREHCKITFKDNDIFIEDLQSSNGTFVNSRPIDSPAKLKHKDHIQIGDVLLILDTSDIAAAEQTFIPDGASGTQVWKAVDVGSVRDLARQLCDNIAKVIKGKDDVIRKVVIALLSDGHILLEDVPGVGKTKLAQALAKSINTDFKRIQFTSDMLPNDVTGVNVYDEAKRQFVFMPGPIFSNIVLADEINRGTPRVQSSLLECMSEAMVTVDGLPYILRKPFFVIATQNPVESHGTYPLPEAQLDRFIMKLSMGYPEPEAEKDILAQQADSDPITTLSGVIKATDLLHCQSIVLSVHVSEPFRDYVVAIVNETRRHEALAYGCSPRAAIALMHASQALAALSGRNYVLPRDARDLAPDVLCHRLPLKLQARSTWHSTANVLQDILSRLPIERWESACDAPSDAATTQKKK